MSPNFTDCKARFQDSSTLRQRYGYNGTVRGVWRNLNSSDLPLLITVEGCRAICGMGSDLYTWQDASATISTWILPIIGLMLQAPYESNEFISTLFFIARIVGSPIATMGYILWNIEITAKCALFVDMATDINSYPGTDSQFEQMRDSFYLLSVMNQYSIKHRMPRIEAEKLLRIALWSDSLQLEIVEEESRSLVQRRRKLARTIRESRKRGVVPVFVTLMWFLFSLIVSIQAAFGELGENATAHNMAVGWLLAWLPSLILFSVVDRNPIAADTIRIKLNRLLDATRKALLDENLRDTYIREAGRQQKDFQWTEQLGDEDYFREDFFTRFAGQGRVRWHYGVAPSIIAGIEKTRIVHWGRAWSNHGDKAREKLVKGPEKLYGLHWFDKRGAWQIFNSFFLFGASIFGAFIVSYFTPTVGFGCRSGGYVVYFVLALSNAIIEGLCWAFIQEGSWLDNDPISYFGRNLHRRLSHASRGSWRDSISNKLSAALEQWKHLTARDKWERLLLRPLDVLTSLWLTYIVLSQVFGFYRTCDCQCSIWGTTGGYMDFQNYDFYRGVGVARYWTASATLSGLSLGFAFIHAVIEWCQQSHIATENYEKALEGLRWTRWFRRQAEKFYSLFRYLDAPMSTLKSQIEQVLGLNTSPSNGVSRKPLRWASKSGNAWRIDPVVKTPTIEMEDGASMRRRASRASWNSGASPTISPPTSFDALGVSFENPTSLQHPPNSQQSSTSYSPAASIITGGRDANSAAAAAESAAMDRRASRSSQGIERKPLLSSPQFSHRRSRSSGTMARAWDMDMDMERSASNDSASNGFYEHVIVETEDPLLSATPPPNRPLRTMPTGLSRAGLGPGRSTPATMMQPPPTSAPRSEEGGDSGDEDLRLDPSISRSRAY